MGEIKNDYYSIACDDLRCMQFLVDGRFYNQVCVYAQQVAEKMLKSVMELVISPDSDTERFMRSYNLKLM